MISGVLRPVGTLIYGVEYPKLLEKPKNIQETCFENIFIHLKVLEIKHLEFYVWVTQIKN